MEWLNQIFSDAPTDAVAYFALGAVGTILFVLRMSLMLVFGIDDGGDFELGHHGGDAAGHGDGFSLFSILSIMSFMMGAGWLGFAARTEWGMSPALAALSAGGFGFGLMLLASGGMWQLKKFNDAGHYNVQSVVGRTGRVYLTVPAQGEGTGQVELNVDGRRTILVAKSRGQRIESFATVKVIELQDGDIVLVEPI